MTILSARGVSKKHCRSLRRGLWYAAQDVAGELLPLRRGGGGSLRDQEFWAVDDVSFELARGESLAIVGQNGSGKTTLLKVLYGLLKPDRGEVRLRGRVEALIELGTGINPVLSGSENVDVGAALRGLHGKAAAAYRERVADFSELGALLDVSVQSYSAGMKARLAFAMAAMLESEILLVDEALAVGDLQFQRKCVALMRDYLDRGGALLLVSHSPWHVQAVCDRGILLDRGRVAFEGSAVEALSVMYEQRAAYPPLPAPVSATGDGLSIEEILVQPREVVSDGSLHVTVRYRATRRMAVTWGLRIWTADRGTCIAGEHDWSVRVLEPGAGELHCLVPHLPLAPGHYLLRVSIDDAATRLPIVLHGWKDTPTMLHVESTRAIDDVAKLALGQLVTMHVEWS